MQVVMYLFYREINSSLTYLSTSLGFRRVRERVSCLRARDVLPSRIENLTNDWHG